MAHFIFPNLPQFALFFLATIVWKSLKTRSFCSIWRVFAKSRIRINTCKSVSKQTTSTPFRIIHLCKTRRGEGLLLTSHAQFSVSCVLPSQCPLCFCLPRPGRGRKSHVLSSLPPLCRSFRSFSTSVPLFSLACSSFSQNT